MPELSVAPVARAYTSHSPKCFSSDGVFTGKPCYRADCRRRRGRSLTGRPTGRLATTGSGTLANTSHLRSARGGRAESFVVNRASLSLVEMGM